jgi:phosphoenolpyruvate carboxylase
MTATMAAVIKVIYPMTTGTEAVVRVEVAVEIDGSENVKRNQESITGVAET